MTPEREAILRRLAVDRDWGGAPFVNELLAELDALRAKVGAFEADLKIERARSAADAQRGGRDSANDEVRTLRWVIGHAREIGLFEVSDGE